MDAAAAPLPPGFAAWWVDRHQAVLATTRRDGTPQTSNVAFAVADGVARVSVTADRAKTRNLQRHPRAVLHVLGDTFWQYAAVTVDAELQGPSTTPGDDVGRALLALHDDVADTPHPAPEEFFQAMVDDRRMLLRLTPVAVVGWNVPGTTP